MAYKMYLDGVLMPITPSKVKVKINNQNKTLTLINGEEINILKEAALTDVSFDLILPQSPYPFSNGGAQSAQTYLNLFERLKKSKAPFQWILNRSRPSGAALFYSNLTVGMEDYQITDDVKEGMDIGVSIKLRQYRAFGTKTVKLSPPPAPSQPATATVEPPKRETSSAPKKLGDGSRWKEIYELNKDKVKNPNLIYPDQSLTLPS